METKSDVNSHIGKDKQCLQHMNSSGNLERHVVQASLGSFHRVT